MAERFPRAGPLAGLALGLICIAVGGWNAVRAFPSYSWPSVHGEIIEAGFRRGAYTRGQRAHFVEVRYRYEVQGAAYEGYRFGFGAHDMFFNQESMQELLYEYMERPRQRVFHDPADPAESVLVPGVALIDWFLLCAGVGLLVLAVALYDPKRGRARPPDLGS